MAATKRATTSAAQTDRTAAGDSPGRVATAIPARVKVDGAGIGDALCVSISLFDFEIETDYLPPQGSRVVAELAGGAILTGATSRARSAGFVVALDWSDADRARLARRLELLRGDARPPTRLAMEQRRADRIDGIAVDAACRTPRGSFKCQVLSISASGAAISLGPDDPPLKIGDDVRIGETRGRVTRIAGDVFGVAFDGAVFGDADADDASSRGARGVIAALSRFFRRGGR